MEMEEHQDLHQLLDFYLVRWKYEVFHADFDG